MKTLQHFMLPEQTNQLYKKEAVSSISLVRDVADKINELVDAYNEVSQWNHAKHQEQDGAIRKGILYMKDNLVNTINDMLQLLYSSGDLQSMIDAIYSSQVLKNTELLSQLNFVTPEMFGAIGDGFTDDSYAIQRTLSTGKNILLTKKYSIRNKISLAVNDLIVSGGHFILDDSAAEEFVFDIQGKNILFDSIIFEHKGYNAARNKKAQNGVKFSNCSDVTLRNCKFISSGAYINGILDFYNDWENVKIEGCIFDINTYYDDKYHAGGVWFRDMNNNGCKNLILSNCIFNSKATDEVLAVWSTGKGIENVNIANCEFNFSNMAHGVTICAKNVTVASCIFNSKAINTILKTFFDDTHSERFIVSDCVFNDNFYDTVSFNVINNGAGENIQVKGCIFKGYSFGARRCDFYNCTIAATDNRSSGAYATFNGCNIKNKQISNQLFNSAVTLINCIIETTGSFLQGFYAQLFTVQNCSIKCNDNKFVVAGNAAYLIMNNNFYGTMPDLYSLKASDIVMSNRFASSPNQNNGNLPSGWTSNVIN